MSNSLRRVVTALVAAPVVLILAYVGGWPFAGVVAGVGILGQREFYQMTQRVGAHPHSLAGLLLGGLVVSAVVHPALWPVVGIGVMLFVIFAPFLLPEEQFVFSFAATLTGVAYPTGLLASLVWLRSAPGGTGLDAAGVQLVVLTLLLVWATDVAAYYVGREFGSRPLAPSISPNKTWEGTLGGVCAAAVMGVGLQVVWIDVLSWPHLAVLVVIAGGLGQLGDLLESRMKRATDLDDSSDLLPGHGGILDRFDAMAIVAPLVALYLDVVAGLL